MTHQADNEREFTYKYISEDTKRPFDAELRKLGIEHKPTPPWTPRHNGKVERSHRSVEDLNMKLVKNLQCSNNKTMRTLGNKSLGDKNRSNIRGKADSLKTPRFAGFLASAMQKQKISFLGKKVHINWRRRN